MQPEKEKYANSFLKAAGSVLGAVEDMAAIFAGVTLFLVMILVSLDALLRYAFHAPLTFQYHLTEHYLMVALVTMPMAWGFRTGGYIRIIGLVNTLPKRGRDQLLRVGLVLSSGYVAVFAWTAGRYFLQTYESGEAQVGVINWPVSWSWIWIPIGCGLLALRLLLTAFGPSDHLVVQHAGAEDVA